VYKRQVRILADAIGRDLQVAPVLESSIRGAAIHALERLGAEVKPLRRGKIVRHSPSLAEQHLRRRERQQQLERRLGVD
jgi:sugar (pentulose or hexulose) kinase